MSKRPSLSRALVHSAARRIEAGHLELIENYPGGERLRFGPGDSGLRARIVVNDPAAYRRIARSQSIGMGEAYALRLWESDDLLSALRIFGRDIGRADGIRSRLARLSAPLQRLGSLSLLNTRRGARRNISAHYDLGNEMFELFLDRETMMYSSARFTEPGQSLEAAQIARLDHICDSLELTPADHVLEIGTGWGGLAVHLALRSGCRVTTTTISAEQRALAERRVAAHGLEDRVTVLGDDYRDLEGSYDKLVSIEMIEAVGWEYFGAFFSRCSELLADDGLMFLQAICVDDRAYEGQKRARNFSNTVIFPGGCLPSLEAIAGHVRADSDMRIVATEDISDSYALTLAEWNRRFAAAAAELDSLGYDERFRRTWEYYFLGAQAGFLEARISDHQLLLAKPRWSGPMVRPARAASAPRAAAAAS